jgi:hypothetical protein
MKKLFLLFAIFLVHTSFTSIYAVRYAFVTDTEHDKAYDEEDRNGYVHITTNIVTLNCNLSANQVKYQYIDHYNAEEKTQTRERAFLGFSGITNVWVYDTYDEALASRRDWLAKKGNEHKRRINYFYVTCK